MTKRVKDKITEVDLSLIDDPKTVDRMEISPESISELAQSISEIGLLQPVLLRPTHPRFEIVAGHRRVLAHKKLSLDFIKAIVREMTDQEAAFIRATENLARKNLTPIEEANVFSNLVNGYELSYEEVGRKFGKSPGLIKRRMDLLKMPPQLQKAVHDKKISISVAEELWPISDTATLDYYLSFALDGGCTKEIARMWCKDWKDSLRRKEAASGEGVQILAPSEPRPIYVACDICVEAIEIGKETTLRVCPSCAKVIRENMQ